MANTVWVGSPNFTPGRAAPIDKIVVHWMAGWLAGADATFQNTARQTSAHYGIEDGTVHQYVKDADTAWHAGDFATNSSSIGIEHSAQPGRDATDATYTTSINLIADICRRYGLDPYASIKPHNQFFNTQCPGTLDLERLKAGAAAVLGTNPVAPAGATITPITPSQEEEMTPAQMLELKQFVQQSMNDNIDRAIKDTRAQVAVAAGNLLTALDAAVWAVKTFSQASDNATGDRIINDARAQVDAARAQIAKITDAK